MNNETTVSNFNRDVSWQKRCLIIFSLFNLCVAQPVYDILSRNTEFFVGHNTKPFDFICFVLVLTIILPTILILLEHTVTFFNKKAGTVLHLAIVTILLICGLLPVAKKILSVTDSCLIIITIAMGVGLTLAYWRLSLVKKFLLYCSVGIVVFPILFLFLSPVQKLIFITDNSFVTNISIKKPVPIVFILFDEFKTMALLNHARSIDPVRYPNFAELSNNSYWFPRATTAYPYTTVAIPAILSGKYPDDTKRIPITSDYPDNLFTLLACSYDLYVYESATELCPNDINKSKNIIARYNFVDRWKALYNDISIIFMHLILPKNMESSLPDISQTWKGFGQKDQNWDPLSGWKNATGDRPQLINDFLDGIQPQKKQPAFHFLHILIPHLPYMYIPSGQNYSPPVVPEGLKAKMWYDDPGLVDLAYQRYLLQVGYADHIVGRVIDRLKKSGLYDKSLVIVTADHGANFKPGEPNRILDSQNYMEILPVPLFVKLPHQDKGIRSERNVETTDIVPTIANVLDIEIPWKLDGHSMISPDFPDRSQKKILKNGGGMLLDSVPMVSVTSFPQLDEQLKKYGSETSFDDLRIHGDYSFLVGKNAKSIEIEKAGDFFVEFDQSEIYRRNIDVFSSYIPLYITGRIKRTAFKEIIPNIAVAINGRIEIVTQIIKSLGEDAEIRVLLPKNALVDGTNNLDFFFIEKSDDDSIILKEIRKNTYELICEDKTNHFIIKTPVGKQISISDGVVRSSYSIGEVTQGIISLKGWAIDEKNKKPANSVVIFSGNQFVKKVNINVERQDIVDWLGNSNYLKSGFSVELPFASVRYSEIRVYALLANGSGSEAFYFYQNPCCLAHEKWPHKVRPLLFNDTRLDVSEAGSWYITSGEKKEEHQVIAAAHIKGKVEQLNESESCVECIGWAVDEGQIPPPKAKLSVTNGKPKWVLDPNRVPPPKAVLVFQGDTLIFTGTINRPRPDIVKKYNNPDLLNSGFHFAVPKSSFKDEKISALHFFAVSDDNKIKALDMQ